MLTSVGRAGTQIKNGGFTIANIAGLVVAVGISAIIYTAAKKIHDEYKNENR